MPIETEHTAFNHGSHRFGNLRFSEHGRKTRIKFRKKYEPALYLFMVFAYGFIGTMLFYLIPLGEENNPDSESNVFNILKALFYLVGTVMLIGGIIEFLKREWIEIDSYELNHGYTYLGIQGSGKSYVLKNIRDLKLAPPPVKGWRLEETYKDAWRTKKDYTNDFRKVYPAVSFMYEGSEVLMASGISSGEAESIISLIKKQ